MKQRSLKSAARPSGQSLTPRGFLTDEDVPESVVAELRRLDQHVQRSRDVLGYGEPDALVARLASDLVYSVVTFNCKDYKRLLGREMWRHPSASCVLMDFPKPQAIARLRVAWPILQSEMKREYDDQRLFVRITKEQVTIFR